ncbi:hypothetical protein CEUSTIGMA_g1587.t1 [Chlamydomonas eustigma]|uniref:Uncharacterized protein n=1 Tax=Chlamydomonas eustigma TaxID=1157962 RepID=A0A250WTI9_9CHLO|nr:hypothetical protein CEUSTIGMA_g1587.t1 [Chlamydomonas eustigma]|eukprot:GAX74138.1 hypothetical protein CEUSTIGMA_g1587.t1 [Chlamydomonas eustigma]
MTENFDSESGVEEDGGAADFSGNLRSSLCWDPYNKQFGVKVKQNIENGRKILFKWQGQLNTTTGGLTYKGYLRKNILSNTPMSLLRVMVSAQEERQGEQPTYPEVNPNRFIPGGLSSMLFKDWILGPGLTFFSTPDRKINYALTIIKAPQFLLHSPKLDCWLTGKATCSVDPKTSQISTLACIRLKTLRYNITSKQDLRVDVGVDFEGKGLKQWVQTPFFTVAENNISLKLKKSCWMLFYTL